MTFVVKDNEKVNINWSMLLLKDWYLLHVLTVSFCSICPPEKREKKHKVAINHVGINKSKNGGKQAYVWNFLCQSDSIYIKIIIINK